MNCEPDVLAVLGRSRALDHREPVARSRAGSAPGCSQSTVWAYSVNTTTRSLVQCAAVGPAHRVEERQQRVEPGVGPALVAQAPVQQRLELAGLGGGQRVGALRLAQPFGLVLLPQALFLVGLALAEDVVVVVVAQAAAGPGSSGSG